MHGSTTGAAAPLRFTTMREEAHITSRGLLCRMPQQAVVISGTSCAPSISGNSVSCSGIVRVDGPAARGEELGVARARVGLALAPARAPGDRDAKPVGRQPVEPVEGLVPGAGAALGLVQRLGVVIEADAQRELGCRRPSLRSRRPRCICGRCIGCMALVSTSASKPRSSASASMARNSGFMNGSPPVKPISRVPSACASRERARPRPR